MLEAELARTQGTRMHDLVFPLVSGEQYNSKLTNPRILGRLLCTCPEAVAVWQSLELRFAEPSSGRT